MPPPTPIEKLKATLMAPTTLSDQQTPSKDFKCIDRKCPTYKRCTKDPPNKLE
jgi:hypothetical protein